MSGEFTKRELFLLRNRLQFASFHYLRANTSYGADGTVKSARHKEICIEIIQFLLCEEFENKHYDCYLKMREYMCEHLTDNLDIEIGLPLETVLRGNEWDLYVDRFIDRLITMLPGFHEICLAVLTGNSK